MTKWSRRKRWVLLWFHFCSRPKGQGRGSIARLHEYETVVFARMLICMNPLLCVWISAWKVNENTVWKQRNENTRIRCQNFFFLFILALGFELHIHIHLNSITYSKTVALSQLFFATKTSSDFLSCVMTFPAIPRLSLLFLKRRQYLQPQEHYTTPTEFALSRNLPIIFRDSSKTREDISLNCYCTSVLNWTTPSEFPLQHGWRKS